MKRNIDLNEISDGRLYSSGDMVKAVIMTGRVFRIFCRGMGDSIKLDPMDIWRQKRSGEICSFDGDRKLSWGL